MRLPWEVKVSPKLPTLSVVGIVVAFSLVATGLSNLPTPGQASTFELICSKTSNATATAEATAVTDTTFRLSITGTELGRGAHQCAGEAIIPEGIITIGNGAFVPWRESDNTPMSNPYLTSIVWPTTVTTINYGLINLRGLTTLDIPSSVTSISPQSFQSLSSLTSANIQGPASAVNTLTLNQYVFNETVTALTIGNGYVNFGANFSNGSVLTSLTLGPNVKSIGERAFFAMEDSRSFTSVNIPPGLTTIGGNAFANNPYFKSVLFGTGKPGITSISSSAFAGSTAIESVQYCGLIDPALSNVLLDSFIAENWPDANIYCSSSANVPTISNLNPLRSPTAGGDLVTLQGANLSNAKVYVDGVEVAVTNNTATSLKFTTPAAAEGENRVRVVTNLGSANPCFRYGSATAPGAPTISAVTAGDSQLSVSFTSPRCNGGAAISEYEYSTNGGANWSTTVSRSSPLVITGLTNGTSYPVAIRARNSVNAGSGSNIVAGTPAPAPAPPTSSNSSAPPSAEVSAVSIRASGTGNSSLVRIKLTKPPAMGEQMSVTVRLLDLDGNLIQELKVPVNSNTSSIEVPVNKAIGAFSATAATSNASVTGVSKSLVPEIVKAQTIKFSKISKAKRLKGTRISGNFAFTPNSWALSPGVRKQLREAAVVAKSKNARVAVTGFAAVSGLGSIFERYVATQRALTVSEFLRKRGVESWIYYKGLSGPEGLSFPGPQPRRVEIRILK
jgi:outer membrane protein OmpA-like peptidoglycan-associated protein